MVRLVKKTTGSGTVDMGFRKRNIPEMPEGYYSGDKPNPTLRAFVEAHMKAHPYDPATDDYHVKAFDRPIETTKATAIYNMHTYWSKKPHDAICQYIRHYTQPGDLVLDPFCGSGGTALAALMEGRAAIAIDRSPAATFITKNYCTPVDADELKAAFTELKRKVKPEIDWLYETRCDRCGGKATTGYTVYSQVFQCPRCLNKVPLFDCKELEGQTAAGKPRKVNACPHCHARGIVEEISTRGAHFGAIPVLVSYLCENGCSPARGERRHDDSDNRKREYFEKYDLGKLQEIEAKPIPHWYPDADLAEAIPFRMLHKKDFRREDASRLTHLFTKRNLWALAALLRSIRAVAVPPEVRDPLLFCFTGNLLNASNMYQYRISGKGGYAKGTYYVPQEAQVMNAWRGFEDKLSGIVRGYGESGGLAGEGFISTQSAQCMDQVPDGSIDLIFTDPPYAGTVQYGELNFVWEAWLGFDTRWHDEEIIVNETRGKTEADWAAMMRQAMAECYRVLKPGRWLSLCYHDTSEGTWTLIQDIMAEAGFIPDATASALFIDAGQKSYNQLTADKVSKRDLVINFRKPKPGDAVRELRFTGDEDAATFGEKARAIVRDYLVANPGATKDRVYDTLVSKMVRAGEMEAHNFDELLAQVAEPVREPLMRNLFDPEKPNLFGTHEVTRWYVKETAVTVDEAESAKEDAAAAKVRVFLEQWQRQHPAAEGVHYSDLFEQYLFLVPVKERPRRLLQDWLLDYFFKTPKGAYRLPVSEEEEALKARGRAAGTSRQIKRCVALLQGGAGIPDSERPTDATLAEWIRQCKRAGMFAEGKLLYEQGGLHRDRLGEEAEVEVDEDYQTCVRALARHGDAVGAKRESRRNDRGQS